MPDIQASDLNPDNPDGPDDRDNPGRWAFPPNLLDLLSDAERTRALQSRHLSAYKCAEYVVSRALRRTVLAAHLFAFPSSLRFDIGPHGKPRVHGRFDLHFSLTHRGGWILLAVTRLGALGVDLELLDRSLHARQRIATWRKISRQDGSHGEGCSEDSLRNFYAEWTRREALAKANGCGLGRPEYPQEPPLLDSQNETRAVGAPCNSRPVPPVWFVEDLELGSNFCAAIALHSNDAIFHFYDASQLEGLNTNQPVSR